MRVLVATLPDTLVDTDWTQNPRVGVHVGTGRRGAWSEPRPEPHASPRSRPHVGRALGEKALLLDLEVVGVEVAPHVRLIKMASSDLGGVGTAEAIAEDHCFSSGH